MATIGNDNEFIVAAARTSSLVAPAIVLCL